eukprot:TRINITY_DN5521_c0_g1_i1.p1 TRINITY_DN5521_c0_g1~~TRINITY_DN5521_c0_g1_i1.p1  ORF type:complete len:502 (+),score=29.21 TRINITY_DN5521_c0_g1_i1:292-1797(+)
MQRSRTKRAITEVLAASFGILLVVSLSSAAREVPHGEFALSDGNAPQGAVPFRQYMFRKGSFIWQPHKSAYHHKWPRMKLGWQIFIGSAIGFFGAAVGSVGGVGGGGIFVPTLTLIIGFDPKSSTAISKCMIMGAAASTVIFNLKMKHPTLDLPIIDYDLAMLFQPMLMLGISIGVAFNVIFADWMVTLLLIILFIATSMKAFFKGIDTWKKETIQKKEATRLRSQTGRPKERTEEDDSAGFSTVLTEAESNDVRNGENTRNGENSRNKEKASDIATTIWVNVRWKELGMLVFVWVAFLAIQITKTHSATCSVKYWVLNLLQVPVAFSVSLYEAVCLYKGTKAIGSIGAAGVNWKVSRLCLYLFCGVLAGAVGGLLGLGGGFILGPLLLELGVPPQVSTATTTFVMLFSSAMSVVEYYFLKRFPLPYASYLFAVCFVAAFWGQHVIRKLINLLGRASLVIFALAFVIFVSALTLGGVGIDKAIHKIQNGSYMGFENLCAYK